MHHLNLMAELTWIVITVAISISPGHSRSTGAPPQACATLMPQHSTNSNNTAAIPFELDVDIFQDPGIPTELGTLSYTHSYTPGKTYNCKLTCLGLFKSFHYCFMLYL